MDLIATANTWLDQDPDATTRAETKALLQSGDLEGLKSRFGSRLAFGTAGLRGELGAGPNRMNQVVVAQTALGIAGFLYHNRASYLDSNGGLSVVIGFDGRINSDVFARLSAEIFEAAGVKARLFEKVIPTPIAAFAGKALGASATVVVTASHNPPRDNGYKVYLGGPNGHSQLVPPQDAEIASFITDIAQTKPFGEIPRSQSYSRLSPQLVDDYVDRALKLIPSVEEKKTQRADLKIAYTAMHGVGHSYLAALFANAGFEINSVMAQQEPDGSFPTVAFPNPEEPGAMDLAFELAKEIAADLVIANDPDADRVAIGYGNPPELLTGDQVGMILAEYLAAKGAKVIANSIVSQDLSPIAARHGIEYQQTLTGFKWISKVPNLDYGYEEALGYCVDPEFTPDKDGITAALLMAEIASELKAQGKDLGDELTRLAELYGESATGQVSIRVQDLSVIDHVMKNLRSAPPTEILGRKVDFEDLLRSETQKTDAVVLSNSELQVIFRPSGTEPKLKCYLQLRGNGAKAELEQLESWAGEIISRLSPAKP
jgi:phosphomannomutase